MKFGSKSFGTPGKKTGTPRKKRSLIGFWIAILALIAGVLVMVGGATQSAEAYC